MSLSQQQQPLVGGGRVKGIPACSTFHKHAFPEIYENTIIIAAVHPNIKLGDPIRDGWFLSDFYAFNYLLKGATPRQTWLTAANPNRLIKDYGNFLHGNPFHDRKVVLSYDLLENQLTPVHVVRTNRMIPTFLQKVKQACALARREEAPILLLVFCHGHENNHLLLDARNSKKGLSIQALKGVLDPAVRVTLLSTACFSGAWAATPDLNFTVLAAADELSSSNSWCAANPKDGYSGSLFVSTTIAALSDVTTPLLPAEERQQQSSGATAPAVSGCLQPEDANEDQTLTYNALCHAIGDVLRSRITRLWQNETFTFSAANDQWGFSWTGRTAIPVLRFEDRWAALPVVSSKFPLWQLANPDPANELFQEGAQTFSASGGHDQEILLEEIATVVIKQQAKDMVRVFLNTCPGDWNSGRETGLGGILGLFLEDDPRCDLSAVEVRDILNFRWELALQADRILEELELPAPNNEFCILWDSYQFAKRMVETIGRKEYRDRYRAAWSTLLSGGCHIPPADNQGPPFYRFLSYLSSAITEVDGLPEERASLAHKVCGSVARLKEFYHDRALESPTAWQRGRDWLRRKSQLSLPLSKLRGGARK